MLGGEHSIFFMTPNTINKFQVEVSQLCTETRTTLISATSPAAAPPTRSCQEAGSSTRSQTTRANMSSTFRVSLARSALELRLMEVVAGECISNDPVVGGEAQYKPWSGPFGSARPIRGIHYRYLEVTLTGPRLRLLNSF